MSGTFITFEGGEGSGKTTQVNMLKDYLLSRHTKVTVTREPGGTPFAERLRSVILSGECEAVSPLAEYLVFSAARLHHLHQVINPALAQGHIVICDRFIDSSLVYQGLVHGADPHRFRQYYLEWGEGVMPKVTILLDMDPGKILSRLACRPGQSNRFDQQGLSFHEKVRAGFLRVAQEDPGRFYRIDGSYPPAQVHQAIISQLHAKGILI